VFSRRYFLFAASLILLSNEFAVLQSNPTYESSITKAIGVIEYCARTDPQARRLRYILTTFRDVVSQKRAASIESARGMATYPLSPVTTHNPMASIFAHDQPSYPSSARGSFAESARKESLAEGAAGGAHATGIPMAPPSGVLTKDSVVGGVSGASPASTGGYSGDGIPGRASDMDASDHLGDEEVNFEALWHWSGAASSGAVQMPEPPPAQTTAMTVSQYAPYFTGDSGTPGPAGSMASSVPLYATSQYQRSV
jgi:hypothetical protein